MGYVDCFNDPAGRAGRIVEEGQEAAASAGFADDSAADEGKDAAGDAAAGAGGGPAPEGIAAAVAAAADAAPTVSSCRECAVQCQVHVGSIFSPFGKE